MRYVGLDARWRQSTICVLEDRGRKILSRTIKGPWSKVLEELEQIRNPFEICFEASTGYGYLFERLQGLARRVVVAHPGQLRPIFRSKRKNERVDAEKLAKLLFLDPKNAVRALPRSQGIEAPKGLWTLEGTDWLRTVSMATELDERSAFSSHLGL